MRTAVRALLWLVWLPGSLAPAGGAEPVENLTPIVASRVLYASDPGAIGPGGSVNPAAVRGMVDALVLGLTGRKTVAAAWRSMFNPQETVGIKVSAAGGRVSGTRVETTLAVVRGLRAAGLPREQIVVWDRSLEELIECGFSRKHPDYVLDWIDPASGYDSDAPVSAPLLGRLIWGDAKFAPQASHRFADLAAGPQQMSSQSFFARVLSQRVDKVIHIPSLQDSILTGINGALAGMVVHNLDNWRRFTVPPQFGDPYLAEIYFDEKIAGKVVVTILDGLFLQYAGGPFPSPANTLDNFTIYASFDPVAIDFLARRMIDDARALHKLPATGARAAYIESAAAYGLGVAEDSRIRLKRAGRVP